MVTFDFECCRRYFRCQTHRQFRELPKTQEWTAVLKKLSKAWKLTHLKKCRDKANSRQQKNLEKFCCKRASAVCCSTLAQKRPWTKSRRRGTSTKGRFWSILWRFLFSFDLSSCQKNSSGANKVEKSCIHNKILWCVYRWSALVVFGVSGRRTGHEHGRLSSHGHETEYCVAHQ